MFFIFKIIFLDEKIKVEKTIGFPMWNFVRNRLSMVSERFEASKYEITLGLKTGYGFFWYTMDLVTT